MMRIAIITCGLSLFINSITAQLVVDNSITLDEAMTLLLGPDVDYSNVTFSGANNQIGSFTSSGFDMGFPNGLILASGDCSMAPGPNNAGSLSVGGGFFGASDADLDQLDGLTHNDAAILEFDFVATGSSVSFRYVWASEEYPEFSGGDENEDGFADCGDVSDVFGFFLSGPGIAGPFSNSANNIALIPGSTAFVSIHNLNAGCDGMAAVGDTDCNFCEYYVNNEGVDAQFLEYLQYDGLTVTLVASYEGLQCGETYHIKLAMADVSDAAWDSAVFLEAGSFDVSGSLIEAFVVNPSPELGDNSILEGCIDGTFVIHPPGCQTEDIVIELFTGGTATEGVDYTGVPASVTISGEDVIIPITTIADNIAEGTENITLYFIYTNIDDELDTASATINLVDYTLPTVTVDDVFICGNAETTVVNVEHGFGDFSYLYSSGETTETATYTEGDAGEYTFTVIDYCDESASDDFVVEEPTPLIVTPSYELCFGVFSGLIAEGGATPYIYTYETDSLILDGENGFQAVYSGVFEVVVTDQCGNSGLCIITTEQCETIVPNIFTPNGDGVNDAFVIEGIDGFPSSSLKIYNRWGNLLLESSNYSNNWNAADCPDGVYYYIFARSDGKTQEGYVHVLSQK